MIIFLTQDLMMQSRVAAAAGDQQLIAVSHPADALSQLAQQTGSTLFIDLQTPGVRLAELDRQLQDLPDPPRTIAYAQHVEVDLLRSARNSSFDRVLTRGQFSQQVRQLIENACVPSSSQPANDDQ